MTSPQATSTPPPSAPTALPDYAPVLPGGFGPPINESGYHVAPIGGNLYCVTDGNYQAMFLSTREGVVLVDAPPTLGHNLQRAIDEVTIAAGRPNQVTHVVYSHSHADHIGAAGLFGSGVERIAHVEADRLLTQSNDPNRPRPTTTFGTTHTLEVGGERLVLNHHGVVHTADNIFIEAPDYDTLFVVDVMYPGWAPFHHLALSAEIRNWIEAHDRIMDYSWSSFLGGHLGRVGTREDGEILVRYVKDLENHARVAINEVDPTPYFVKYGPTGDSWAMMRHYWAALAAHAAEPMVETYRELLSGVEASATENAYTMVTSLMHDDGVLPPALGIRP